MKKIFVLIPLTFAFTACLKEIPEPNLTSNPWDSTGVRYGALVKIDSSRSYPMGPLSYLLVYYHVKYSKLPKFLGMAQSVVMVDQRNTTPIANKITPTDTCFHLKVYNLPKSSSHDFNCQIEGERGSKTRVFLPD
jgi:hypothetical protein